MKVVMLVHNDMRSDARVEREAATLASAGHTVKVLALRGDGLPAIEQKSGFEILRIADLTTASWAHPASKLAQSRERAAAMRAAAIALEPEVVHCHDLNTLAIGAEAAERTSARLVYDAHELFTEMTGFAERPALARWYWDRLERRLAPVADLAITVNGPRAAELERRLGVRFEVVENAPVLEPLAPGTRLRSELGVSAGDVIALYQGGFSTGRALERLVAAASRVEGLVLVLQGYGPLEARLREMAAASDGRIRVMGRIAQDDLHEYACGADLGIVIYENTGLNNYLAAPNKMYAYMMAGLPVAVSDFPGLSSVVTGERLGDVFDPASEDSIASALRVLVGDERLRHEMGKRARRLAESTYNWDTQGAHLVALYERLGGRV